MTYACVASAPWRVAVLHLVHACNEPASVCGHATSRRRLARRLAHLRVIASPDVQRGTRGRARRLPGHRELPRPRERRRVRVLHHRHRAGARGRDDRSAPATRRDTRVRTPRERCSRAHARVCRRRGALVRTAHDARRARGPVAERLRGGHRANVYTHHTRVYSFKTQAPPLPQTLWCQGPVAASGDPVRLACRFPC